MYGSFVRAVRTSRGLSQQALAAAVGMRQSNLSAIENDRRVPSADTLNRLVVACGYELMAVAGERRIACALPDAGWFPDEGLPARLPDDPPEEPAALTPGSSPAERGRLLAAVLELAGAVRAERR
jgi:transcriptional regulator with XRE-family HTH domain